MNKKESSEERSSQRRESLKLLDLRYATAEFLQPKELAQAIDTVLGSLRRERQQPQQRQLNQVSPREEHENEEQDQEKDMNSSKERRGEVAFGVAKDVFVERTLQMMYSGQLQPIGFLLVRNERREKHARLRTPVKTSEERELELCRDKPALVAEKVTNSLVAERYRERLSGRVSIEDSLIASKLEHEQKVADIKAEVLAQELAECTFQPSLIASSMRDLSSASKRRQQSSFSQIRSAQSPRLHKKDTDRSSLGASLHMSNLTTSEADKPSEPVLPLRSTYLLPPFIDFAAHEHFAT